MKSILVTGANTAIGHQLIDRLLADARVAHVLAVSSEPKLSGDRSNARLSYLSLDLTRPREVHDLLFGPARDANVEVVVHLGQVEDPHKRGRRVHLANVEAVRAILDLSDRHPTIHRLILKSYAVVYRVRNDLPTLVTEDHPLNLSSQAPQYVRDRVEADLTAGTRMGLIDAEIVVLRCAEALAGNTGSQLYDFLEGPVAFRPAGFDPMLNVASCSDLVRAFETAIHGSGEGVFNIPGFDTLPLSEAIHKWGRRSIPLPGPLIRPLYQLRHMVAGSSFEYGLNRHRMHLGLVLDGTRARDLLGYEPSHPIDWPVGGPVTLSSPLAPPLT